MAPTSDYNFVVPSETAFGLVTIGRSDLRDVTLRTTRTVTVHGRFRMESDNPEATWPPDISVGAYLVLDGMDLVPSAQADGGPNGTFTLRGARRPHVLRTGSTLAPGSKWWPSKVVLDGVERHERPYRLQRWREPPLGSGLHSASGKSQWDGVGFERPACFSCVCCLFSADQGPLAALVNDITSLHGGRDGRVQRGTASRALPCTSATLWCDVISPTTTRL